MSIHLPNDLKLKIRAIPTLIAARGDDRLAWRVSNHSDFKLKSVYSISIDDKGENSQFPKQRAWKVEALP